MDSLTNTVAVKPPPIPSKHEIIPIHASDRGTFKRCRRRWNWSSPMRNNLVPRSDLSGVVLPPWFGSGIHWALAQFYNPSLQRDPVEAFIYWYELVMHGGTVTADKLDICYDRKPMPHSDGLFEVRGLAEFLPDSNIEPFEEHRVLGINMMEFYRDYADRNDNFAVICEEHTFSVPILDPDGIEVHWRDPRDGEKKPVHIRGTQDAIIQDLETGQFGILEHKTAIRIDEDYHRKLDKDEQCTTYMYAAEREAYLHDLEYEKISFVLYNAVRKTYPKPPTELKSGLFSTNRQTESTTPAMLEEFIRSRGLEIVVESDERLQAYIQYVNEVGDEQYVVRTPVRRNRAEIESCGNRIYMEVMDMLDNPRIYPNPTGDYMCLNCPFRGPCIAADDGGDVEALLTDGFEVNHTR
jgi:PD-(D/E)XK nuclease superfamily